MHIAFDLDGTLIDSIGDIHAAVDRVIGARGMGPLDIGTVRGFVGDGAPVLLERVSRHLGLPDAGPAFREMLAEFLGIYETGSAGLTEVYPGVREALAQLRDRGHMLSICTNKPIGPTRKVLSKLGLDGFFGVVLGGDSLPVRKPDPAPLRAALEGAAATLFVGDSEVDAETAARAGVPFALFTEGYRRGPAAAITAAHRFSDWTDMPAFAG